MTTYNRRLGNKRTIKYKYIKEKQTSRIIFRSSSVETQKIGIIKNYYIKTLLGASPMIWYKGANSFDKARGKIPTECYQCKNMLCTDRRYLTPEEIQQAYEQTPHLFAWEHQILQLLIVGALFYGTLSAVQYLRKKEPIHTEVRNSVAEWWEEFKQELLDDDDDDDDNGNGNSW